MGDDQVKDKITVYQKPTCTTCRDLDKILRESGAEYEKIDYYLEPIGRDKLRALLEKMGMKPHDLLRTREPIYKDLGLAEKDLSDDEIIDLMAEYPDLIQRPIVERGAKAVLARPAEIVRTLLT